MGPAGRAVATTRSIIIARARSTRRRHTADRRCCCAARLPALRSTSAQPPLLAAQLGQWCSRESMARSLLIVAALIRSSAALNNGVGRLPAMGWTSVSDGRHADTPVVLMSAYRWPDCDCACSGSPMGKAICGSVARSMSLHEPSWRLAISSFPPA